MAAPKPTSEISRMAIVDEPARPRNVVQEELLLAKAEIRRLRALCEEDAAKGARRAATIAGAMKQWKQTRPTEPFDPNMWNPPLLPHKPDEDLHRRHHRQHYIVAELEEELERASKVE